MKTILPVPKLPVVDKGQQWPQFVTVFLVGILAWGAGLHFGWPSPSIPKLLEKDLQFEVTKEDVGYITMVAPFGYFIGCPLFAVLLDVLGRKKCLLLLAIPQIAAWLLIAFSKCVFMLYAARVTAGFAEGALFTTLPVYLCEISEPKIRGILGTNLTVGMIVGILLINCYGSYLSIRTTAFISIAFPVVFLVTFIWMPESPYFLLMKDRNEDAKNSLKTLRRMDDVEEELTQMSSAVKRQTAEPSSLKDVFAIKSNLKAFLVVIGLRTIQQFSGVSAFSVYTQVIFQQAAGGVSPEESSIIYIGTQVAITCWGSFLVDKFGRKPMVMSSTMTTAIFLFIEGLYFYFQRNDYDLSSFKWLPITGMMMYIIVFSVGLGVAPNLMMGELFSASIKAKALGVTNLYFAICLSVSYKLFQFLDSNYGMHVPFFFFSACCLVGFTFSCFCIPETKGKTLEEIQQILKGNKSVKDKVASKLEEINVTRF